MHGLYLLWWVQEKQISPAAVAAILAAGDLVLLAVELPTGWFADRYGHRASLVAGSLVQVLGILWCWLGQGIGGLIAASVLIAIGDGFRSGAADALLYRTCVVLGQEDAFQRLQARTSAAESASLVGLVLTGGLIVSTLGFEAGWIAESALCALGLVIACAMTEPPRVEACDAPRTQDAHGRGLAIHLAALVVPAALLGGLASAASYLAQAAAAVDAVSVTVLVAVIALAEAGGSLLAVRLPARGARDQALLTALGAVLFGAGIAFPSVFVAVVPALAFLDGVAGPLRATLIQRASTDDVRDRMASLASACDMAVSTVALPLAGLARSRR